MNTDPHNLIYTFIGCFLIWIGWFCFNGGSALGANSQAALALFNTQMAACTGGVTQIVWGYVKTGKIKATDSMNGILSGLAAITAGSG